MIAITRGMNCKLAILPSLLKKQPARVCECDSRSFRFFFGKFFLCSVLIAEKYPIMDARQVIEKDVP